MSDDWQVVEEARLERIHRAWEFVPLNLYDEITKLAEIALGEYIAEIARLREREAQLEQRYTSEMHDYEKAEQRAEAAEARVAELEEALRSQMRGGYDAENGEPPWHLIARRALAHKEEEEA
jgi:multidrug efflux pump subunit AcrA (membrane-fusion protein)